MEATKLITTINDRNSIEFDLRVDKLNAPTRNMQEDPLEKSSFYDFAAPRNAEFVGYTEERNFDFVKEILKVCEEKSVNTELL